MPVGERVDIHPMGRGITQACVDQPDIEISSCQGNLQMRAREDGVGNGSEGTVVSDIPLDA